MIRLSIFGLTFSASAAGLTPTHSILEGTSVPIRRNPDPNEKPFGRLPGGHEVHVEIHVGAWARLVGEMPPVNGRPRGWAGAWARLVGEMPPVNGRPRGWVIAEWLTEVPGEVTEVITSQRPA